MAAIRNIIFYPEHPTDEKTHLIEITKLPVLEQEEPFEIKAFCDEFQEDAESFFAKYIDKRFVVKVGDTVVVRANYLVMSNLLGIVMKYSELLEVN